MNAIVRMRARQTISWITALAMVLSLFAGFSLTATAADEAAEAVKLYVDTNHGDDSNVGTLGAPFQTLQAAQAAVRGLNDNMTSDIFVYLRGGNYTFEETMVFDESDSGTNGYEVIYTSYPGEMATLHAGEQIVNWEPHEGSIYKAQVGADWDFETVNEDGVLATKARFPNTGYSRVAGYNESNPRSSFFFKEGDIPQIADLSDLEIFAIPGGPSGEWSWTSSITGITSIDHASKFVQLEQTVAYDMGIGSRYFVMGSLELLDAPGEFYLDKEAGVLYYWPMALPIESRTITAPKMRKLISLEGSSESSRVSDIRFEGLTFTGADRPLNDTSYDNALITMTNSDRISILDNIIENTAGYGVSVVDWASHNTISGNLIRNTGRHGVSLISGNYQTLQYKNHFNTVSNNHIYNFGLLNIGAPGIGLANSGDNQIIHNLIHDGPRSGIALGGFATNGSNGAIATGQVIEGVKVTLENRYDFKHTRNNVVAYNDLSALNQNSQDTGLIYIWGGGLNNQFVHNYVHDSNIGFSFGHGIYGDDDTDRLVISNNILYNLQYEETEGKLGNAIFARGIGPSIENNLIVANDITDGVFGSQPGGAPRQDFVYERNVVYNEAHSGTNLYNFSDYSADAIAVAAHNLYYHEKDQYMVSMGGNRNFLDWQEQQAFAFDQSSLIGHDPLFRNHENEDYRFSYDSPAYGLGIENVDLSQIGLTAEFRYADEGDALGPVFVKGGAGELAIVELAVGSSSQLEVAARSALGFFKDMQDAEVNFTSLNPEVAVVGADGVVSGVSKGVTQIQVSVTLAGVTKTADIDVAVGDELSELQLSASRTGLQPGQELPVTVTGISEHGKKSPLTADAVFSTSDDSVVSVDANGFVTAVGPGTAVLTAQVGGLTTTLEFGVYERVLDTVSMTPEVSSPLVGTETQISLAGTWTDGTAADLAGGDITYTVDDASIATVTPEGVLTALKSDRVSVTVQVTLNGVTKRATRSIYIRPEESSGGGGIPGWAISKYGDAEAITASQSGKYMITGSGHRLTGIVDDFAYLHQVVEATEQAQSITLTATLDQVDYAGDDQAWAGLMVRKNDTAYAKNAFIGVNEQGDLIVNYRNDGTLPSTETVVVAGVDLTSPPKLRIVKTANNVTMYYGKGAEGYWTEAYSVDVEFSGDFMVGFALVSPSGEEVTAEFANVEVTARDADALLTDIALDRTEYSLFVGEAMSLQVEAAYDNETTGDVTGSTAYTSSDEQVAIVNPSGVITGTGAGTATITASYRGKQASAEVTVLEPMPPVDTLQGLRLDDPHYHLSRGGQHQTIVTAIFNYPSLKRYEAEQAELTGGAIDASVSSGFSGSGYVDGYWERGASTKWTVDAAAGEQELKLRYANAGGARTVSLYVNGAKVKTMSLAKAGNDWNAWASHTETVTLQKGLNTIEVRIDEGDDGNVNLDYIEIQVPTTTLEVTGEAQFTSTRSRVAEVDASGLVTAKTNGTTVIKVTYGDRTVQARVNVTGRPN